MILWNNALVNAPSLKTFDQAYADGAWWGRLVENAVGSHLLNSLQGPQWNVTYWREAGEEVDFVVSHGVHLWAIEVKSGRSNKVRYLDTSGPSMARRSTRPWERRHLLSTDWGSNKPTGLTAFLNRYPKAKTWLVGESGLPLIEFFSGPAQQWFTSEL